MFRLDFRVKSIILIFIVCFLIYGNTLNNGFVTDDFPNVVDNEHVKSFDLNYFFTSHFWTFYAGNETIKAYYMPLSFTSLAIDHAIWNGNPAGFHLSMIIIHALVSSLVFLLVLKLSKSKKISLASALIFAVLPVHAESVSWISGRTHMLALLFVLASLLLYIKFREAGNWKHLSLSIALFAIALLFKETAIVLIPLVIVYDYLNSESLRKCLSDFKKYYLFYIGIVAVAIVYAIVTALVTGSLVPSLPSGLTFATNPIYSQGLGMALLNAPLIFVYYSMLILFNIGFDFPPYVITSPLGLVFFGTLLLALIPLVIALYFRRKKPYISFFSLWIYIGLIPAVVGISSYTTFIVDRLSYIPSVGFAVLLAALLVFVSKKIAANAKQAKSLFIILCVVLISVYGFTAHMRTYDWKDEATLFASIVRNSPENYFAYYELGMIYAGEGRYQEAVDSVKKAVGMKPDSIEMRMTLGEMYYALEMYEEAAGEYAYVTSIDYSNFDAHKNLGFSLIGLGIFNEAIYEFEEAVKIDPNYADGYYNIGTIYYKEFNDLATASLYFQKALEIEPDNEYYISALKIVSQELTS